MTTYWAPKVALGGNYIIQISQSQDFTCGWFYPDSVNVNSITTFGMPDTNIVWYWRICSYKDGVNSPLSEVYDFYYKGTTIINPPWTLFGIEGTPIEKVTYKFALKQNRPNPVNNLAELSFTLPRSGNYSLKIYNIAGQVIRTLDGKGNAGQNTVTWNGLDNGGRKAANGVYLYNLQAFGNSATKKMIILR